MPAVPSNPTAKGTGQAPVPPDPHQSQGDVPATEGRPAVEPAPAIVDTTSHEKPHVFARRFLGPMPRSAATSSKATERRHDLRKLRREALDKLLGEDAAQDELGLEVTRGAKARRAARKTKYRFHVRRRSKLGPDSEEDFEIDAASSSDSSSSSASDYDDDSGGGGGGGVSGDGQHHHHKKKKKKKKKTQSVGGGLAGNQWVGNSFDIGCEFESPATRSSQDDTVPPPAHVGGVDQPEAGPSGTTGAPEQILGQGRQVRDSPPPIETSLRNDEDSAKTPTQDDPRPGLHAGAFGSKPEHEAEPHAGPSHAGPSHMNTTPTPSKRQGSVASTGGDTFVTARTEPDDSDSSTFEAHVPYPTQGPPPSDGQPTSQTSSPRFHNGSQDSSTRPLFHSSDEEANQGEGRRAKRPPLTTSRKSRTSFVTARGSKRTFSTRRLKSALRPSAKEDPDTGHPRGKSVQFPDDVARVMSSRSGGRAPSAHPRTVLERSGSETAGTSAAATEEATVIDDDDVLPGGVVMRDRVLVKVGRHRSENIAIYNEEIQRRDPCTRMDDMEEYVLGMTVTSIDFYLDWRMCLQERLRGHKRLRYSVPLAPPTTISIFSQTDMTLAIVCPWEHIVRNTARHMNGDHRKQTSMWDRARHSHLADRLNMARRGSAIFLVQFGERSRALDWHWYISGQLSVHLPPAIDIRVPSIEQTIRMAVPKEAMSASFNADSTLAIIWKLILSNTQQTRLLRELGRLPKLRLAWKGGPSLDWVCWSTTVTGKPREWGLLASFAQMLTPGHQRSLQVRDATHHGVAVKLADGTKLEEPTCVEGYLLRHKSDVAPREEVYLSVADGHIFMSVASSAVPPLLPRRRGSSPAQLFPELYKKFLKDEQRRITAFIEKCAGCIDLRQVESVKLRQPNELTEGLEEPPLAPHEANFTTHPSGTPRSSPPAPEPRARAATFSEGDRVKPQVSPIHIPDPPPRATTITHTPVSPKKKRSSALVPLKKEGKKKQRQFEMRLRGGGTVVFEARTPEIATEWVGRLTELVRYWSLRRRVDARSAMDLVSLRMGKEAFVGLLDPLTEKLLNQFYNWCVIDGCRPVTFSSRIYLRRSRWSKFRSTYLVLAYGSLVAFTSDGRVGMQPRRAVFSGLLADNEIEASINETAWDPPARVYMDGLQTNDSVEDCTFCVRLTWWTGRWAPPQPWDAEGDSNRVDLASKGPLSNKAFQVPPLRKKPAQLLVCRARSKLERDRWVWALNCEKERFARSHLRDEETLRNYGTLPRHATLTRLDGTV